MGLTLKQSNAIQALAKVTSSFLPGSGARQWREHITFGTVAERAGVGAFWPSAGSKVPRLITLYESTFSQRRERFEALIVGIVKEGLRYRTGKDRITANDIRTLNGHLLDLGFKFPSLWDDAFISSLMLDDRARAADRVDVQERADALRESSRVEYLRRLADLKTVLEQIYVEPDRRRAGYQLERLLNELFTLGGLKPRAPFKIVGEQIDGSFELDHEVYLVEAKWERDPLPEADLLVFRGKVEGKSTYTRGVFIAMNGITRDADIAIRIGKQPCFFVITGYDVMMILQAAISLEDFLRARRRLLAEEAAIAAPFNRVRP